jgi:hypothetical protein
MEKNIIVAAFLIGLILMTIGILQYWTNWRKKALIEAGKSLGFRHLMQGETLPIALVPLIDRADRKYNVILRGEINGYEAAFFDLFCGAGENWFYQSTIMVKNPQIMMPMFQLKSSDWSKVIQQRTCGEPLKMPGREKDMGSLKLSSPDPQWAVQTFSRATPQFFQKLLKDKWTIEGFQHSLVIYRLGKTVSPRKLQEYAKQAGEIAAEMYSLCS